MSERRKREFKHTKGPWRKSSGQYGNTIEAQSGRDPRFTRDDGYTTVASFQAACSSMLHADEEENRAANGRLIIAAPAMLDRIEAILPWLDALAGIIPTGLIAEEIKRTVSLLDYIEKGDA